MLLILYGLFLQICLMELFSKGQMTVLHGQLSLMFKQIMYIQDGIHGKIVRINYYIDMLDSVTTLYQTAKLQIFK